MEMVKQIIEAAKKKTPVKYIVAIRKTRRDKGEVREYYEIHSGGRLIVTLTADDAAANKTTLKELAEQMKNVVQTAVTALECAQN